MKSLLAKDNSYAQRASHKFVRPDELETLSLALRLNGQTFATLNGSFDLLHAGHLEMIYQASLQADCLLMLLNSDASIKQYKSPERPIIPLEQRMQLIAALEMVDYVSWFEETDPRQVLSLLRPDVHVNGAEYGESCIEAEVVKKHGGRIHIVELVPGLSTSLIVKKIQGLSCG